MPMHITFSKIPNSSNLLHLAFLIELGEVESHDDLQVELVNFALQLITQMLMGFEKSIEKVMVRFVLIEEELIEEVGDLIKQLILVIETLVFMKEHLIDCLIIVVITIIVTAVTLVVLDLLALEINLSLLAKEIPINSTTLLKKANLLDADEEFSTRAIIAIKAIFTLVFPKNITDRFNKDTFRRYSTALCRFMKAAFKQRFTFYSSNPIVIRSFMASCASGP